MKADHEKQMAQAEEVLGERLHKASFAKGLFFGQFLSAKLTPYPQREPDSRTADAVVALRRFCNESIDPVAIDRNAEIPDSVVKGLGRLGVLGACVPTEYGGGGFNQSQYCRMIEVLGGHCGSTALFVNAHHSIGPRALVLFGTDEQKARWLPKMASGEWISAFALTEPEAGSDAANVQTTATPSPDGRGYVLNGQKRWITNGGIAQGLTVMARTPVAGAAGETKITAFLVTPDMPGFEVVEKRMQKLGVRGTATSKLAFRNMFVPKENVLGELGRGLRVALTVLDFGRVTFGASCTGAAKRCIDLAVRHAITRVQFEQPLANFELVQDKLAYMQANMYAMEAMTYLTAGLIDSGAEEFMLETALLKVFATEALWRIVNDTFQIYGGRAYFTDEPLERMLRDARINQIGEGANDVLRAFIALVGMRDVGLELKGVLDAAKSPLKHFGRLRDFAGRKLESFFSSPVVDHHHHALEPDAHRLSRLIGEFGGEVEGVLRNYQEKILDRQLLLARIADSACEIFASACVLRRLDHLLGEGPLDDARKLELQTGRYYLQTACRRVRANLDHLWVNDDAETVDMAAALVASYRERM